MPIRSRGALTFTCALMVFVGVNCEWSSPEAKKSQHLDRATSYVEKGQYQEAIIEYRNVVQADPNDGDAHYRLALVHLKIGSLSNLQAAFSELNRALELDKTNRDAQLKLGELYLLGNEPAKARNQSEIVLVSAPQDTEGVHTQRMESE